MGVNHAVRPDTPNTSVEEIASPTPRRASLTMAVLLLKGQGMDKYLLTIVGGH